MQIEQLVFCAVPPATLGRSPPSRLRRVSRCNCIFRFFMVYSLLSLNAGMAPRRAFDIIDSAENRRNVACRGPGAIQSWARLGGRSLQAREGQLVRSSACRAREGRLPAAV